MEPSADNDAVIENIHDIRRSYQIFQFNDGEIAETLKSFRTTTLEPFDEKTDWRGMFVLAVNTQEEAERLVSTDPAIKNGEMIAEYHPLYASAALMAVKGIHEKIASR